MHILILSDVHANLLALKAALSHAQPIDMIWDLGDIVGYGPYPNECVELLQEFDHISVAGNHDWAALCRLVPFPLCDKTLAELERRRRRRAERCGNLFRRASLWRAQHEWCLTSTVTCFHIPFPFILHHPAILCKLSLRL